MKTLTLDKIDTLIKDNKIVFDKVEEPKRKKIPFTVLRNIEMLDAVKQAEDKQIKLGLGSPVDSDSKDLNKIREEVNKYSTSRLMKAGFELLKVPGDDVIPRFNGSIPRNMDKTPKLALAKLSAGLRSINCMTSKGRFSASIPRMPNTVLELAARVKALAPNAEFHLAFMPNWYSNPLPKDPQLLAKVGKNWIKVGEPYGADRPILEEIILKK